MTPPPAEFAPAKVNLALHVTGRRADGYHLLDSIVAFPALGDCLEARPAPSLSLSISGPFADRLEADDPGNLVLRAARLLCAAGSRDPVGASLALSKDLPVAAGLGGGSADAAAALRLLARLWSVPVPETEAVLSLGADVPACLASRPARMRGVGERLNAVELPPFWIVLVNPGVPVPTARVFAMLERRDNPGLPEPAAYRDAGDLFGWLRAVRNDLEEPAQRLEPVIGRMLAAIAAQPGCALARMSGSGATCFGLFAAEAPAQTAAATIARREPGWWVRATRCPRPGAESGPAPPLPA